jgi:hypothetical protein
MIYLVSLGHGVTWGPCYHGDLCEALPALLDYFGMMLCFRLPWPRMDHTKRTSTILKAEGGVGGRGNSTSGPLAFHNVTLSGFLDFDFEPTSVRGRVSSYKM